MGAMARSQENRGHGSTLGCKSAVSGAASRQTGCIPAVVRDAGIDVSGVDQATGEIRNREKREVDTYRRYF